MNKDQLYDELLQIGIKENNCIVKKYIKERLK